MAFYLSPWGIHTDIIVRETLFEIISSPVGLPIVNTLQTEPHTREARLIGLGKF